VRTRSSSSRAVPPAFARKLQAEAASGHEKAPKLLLVAAAQPKLPAATINACVKFVFGYKHAVTAGFPQALAALDRQKLADALPTGILASRAKRSRVLAALPPLLHGGEQSAAQKGRCNG
jgi:hypothetical protein